MRWLLILFVWLKACFTVAFGQAHVVSQTNATFRIMAANITGTSQRYELPAVRIFQGLKPDIVAIQEFNYTGSAGQDTPASIREFVNTAFGTNFYYYRESGAGYTIPNGVISRYPIISSGTWASGIGDRGFAWARIDVPGTNDLYVVSVHLKASSGSANVTTRSNQAVSVKSLVQSNFPTNAWLVVAGDFNIHDSSEPALATFKTFLSDNPIPTDGYTPEDADTNEGRSERYDYVLASFSFDTNRVGTVIGSRTFTKGLVFDSRVYSPLADVAPVQYADSGTAQHMGVLKDFRVTYSITNTVVPRPYLVSKASNVVTWTGPSNLTYSVQATTNFNGWGKIGTASSTTTNYSFTNLSAGPRRFIRAAYP